MASIPKTMKSLAVFKYSEPSDYQLAYLPVPEIEKPNEVLVKVRAGALNTGSSMLVAGDMDIAYKPGFPITIGIEGAGVIVAVGSQVKSLRVGDEVYGCNFRRPAFPFPKSSWCSEYTLCDEDLLLLKPPHLSFEEAASMPSSTVTAYQSIKKGLELMQSAGGSATLEGKTVFVPGALSASGSIGAQLLKNVFGAGKVVATVSTPKMGLVETYIPGIVDKLIDYQKQDPVKELGPGTVDLVYNTQWGLTSTFPLAKKKTGVVMSIASVPPASTMREVLGAKFLPFWICWAMDLVQLWYRFKMPWSNVSPVFISGNPSKREDLDAVGEIIATKKVKPVYSVANLDDIENVRKECQKVRTGKGGIGKLVIKVA